MVSGCYFAVSGDMRGIQGTNKEVEAIAVQCAHSRRLSGVRHSESSLVAALVEVARTIAILGIAFARNPSSLSACTQSSMTSIAAQFGISTIEYSEF